jgi:hypothetical protein
LLDLLHTLLRLLGRLGVLLRLSRLRPLLLRRFLALLFFRRLALTSRLLLCQHRIKRPANHQ